MDDKFIPLIVVSLRTLIVVSLGILIIVSLRTASYLEWIETETNLAIDP